MCYHSNRHDVHTHTLVNTHTSGANVRGHVSEVLADGGALGNDD